MKINEVALQAIESYNKEQQEKEKKVEVNLDVKEEVKEVKTRKTQSYRKKKDHQQLKEFNMPRGRPKKVKPEPTFTDDLVTGAVSKKYGEVVKTGTQVLENINSLQTIGVSPALDMALGGGLREGLQ